MNSNQILGANQETHKFEFPNSFHELMCHLSAIKSPSIKFHQFLKISLKFHQILLISNPRASSSFDSNSIQNFEKF